MNKSYLIAIACEISPPANAPSNVLITAWQRLGYAPSKNQAQQMLNAEIAKGGVVSYAILQEGADAAALCKQLKAQA